MILYGRTRKRICALLEVPREKFYEKVRSFWPRCRRCLEFRNRLVGYAGRSERKSKGKICLRELPVASRVLPEHGEALARQSCGQKRLRSGQVPAGPFDAEEIKRRSFRQEPVSR